MSPIQKGLVFYFWFSRLSQRILTRSHSFPFLSSLYQSKPSFLTSFYFHIYRHILFLILLALHRDSCFEFNDETQIKLSMTFDYQNKNKIKSLKRIDYIILIPNNPFKLKAQQNSLRTFQYINHINLCSSLSTIKKK